jgi:predicted lipoprotein with Yx(FWY)xxD motif
MKQSQVARASMFRTRLRRIVAVALVGGGLFAFASTSDAALAATRPTTASVISTVKNAKLGTLLVSGTTVYALKPSSTACTAKCLKVWPPVLLPQGVMTATAGAGVDESKLGTTGAANGARQITYAGKRLYWFAKDEAPGQVKGNLTDKWGKWYTIQTSTSAATATTSPGNGGVGF